MNPGLLAALDSSTTTIAISATVAIFSEETQRLLCIRMSSKAAQAAGIGALAKVAIDTGDHADALQFIADAAADLAEQLQSLASIAGQITASKAA